MSVHLVLYFLDVDIVCLVFWVLVFVVVVVFVRRYWFFGVGCGSIFGWWIYGLDG